MLDANDALRAGAMVVGIGCTLAAIARLADAREAIEALQPCRRGYGGGGRFSLRSRARMLALTRLTAGAVLVIAAASGLPLMPFAGFAFLSWASAVVAHPFGNDGSDYMGIGVLFGLAVASMPGEAWARSVGCWFLALYVAHVYFIAGVAKLRSSEWRKGTALTAIARTRTFGGRQMERLAGRAPVTAARGLIALEIGFPLALLVPPVATITILAAALTFHLLTAVVAGLGVFPWTFASAFPAVLYCSQTLWMGANG